ncbi:MAG: hypothetical protein FD166_3600 [Bacteroidetes bacterium]|nr:MAG: hypothetical protein FD166_3600 [Bacteroidota bacterium]
MADSKTFVVLLQFCENFSLFLVPTKLIKSQKVLQTKNFTKTQIKIN